MGSDRQSVKTYVPDDQKAVWSDHAEELDMSLSEFVRTMVQAGRRGFTIEPSRPADEPDSPDADPGDRDLETRIDAALTAGPRSWDELVEAVVDDIEDELAETLDDLQARDRVRYSGRDGGYVLTDE